MHRLTRVAGPLLLVLAGATWLWEARPLPVTALTNCSTSTQAIDAQEQQMLQLINSFRAANGAPALKLSSNLSRAAAWMSEDMAAKGYFAHTDSLGRSAFQRVRDCGYQGSGAGENLAIASSAQQAFDLFLNSPGHRANMLLTTWVVAGVGRAGPYWTIDFGTFDDSGGSWDAPTAATPTRTPTPASLPSATATATTVPGPGGTVPATPIGPTATPILGSSGPSTNPSLRPRALVPNITAEP